MEFAAEYGDRVFLFATEKNKNEFLQYPRKYLNQKPKMPDTYNLVLLGAHGSGKMTMAKKLSKRYGWKVINLADILAETVKY